MDTAQIGTALHRAVDLATRGPAAGGNPQVGCVLLAPDGSIAGEGYHRGAGSAHAEVAALRTATGPVDTAVVSLEPCGHCGRTGPCAEALIDAGVRRVVFAVDDPADGAGGADRLRAAGLDVLGPEAVASLPGGVDAVAAAADLLTPWLTAVRRRRPWTTVKWAQSLDGRAAAADGSSQWISGPPSRADVHRRRADSDAILTGTGTVLADDPALTARDGSGALLEHQPRPIVAGSRSVPPDAALRRHPRGLSEAGNVPLAQIMSDAYSAGARRLFVEAGPTLTSAVIRAGLADEIVVYLAPVLIGGPNTALGDLGIDTLGAALRYDTREVTTLGDDIAVVLRPRTENPGEALSSPESRTARGVATPSTAGGPPAESEI